MNLVNIRKHCSEFLPESKNLSEKDIIYLLRNLSPKNFNNTLLDIFQKELIEFLKEKKSNNSFNFFSTDIDRNIILTYPCVHNLHILVDYLITNIYDTKKFSKDICAAIFPSVWPSNKESFDLIFNEYINQEYKDNTIKDIYTLSNRVDHPFKSHYYSCVEKILSNCNFELILAKLLLEPYDLSNEINHFLISSNIPNSQKLSAINNNLDNFGKCFFRKNENHVFVEKFKLHLDLENSNNLSNKSTKNKI